MNREDFKTKRKGQPKQRNSEGRAKRRLSIKQWTPHTTPRLREIYATKTEWATKKLPKLKE
jgi:hypothetical protein